VRVQTKQEKVKVEKCGSYMWTEVQELATLIREGKTKCASKHFESVLRCGYI